MASWVEIELDTRPPEVEFGDVVRGDALIVAYTVDEQGVTAAEFVPAGGSPEPMAVEADRLLLEAWAPSAGAVRATVRDEVWNSAVRELVVRLDGQVPGLVGGQSSVTRRSGASGSTAGVEGSGDVRGVEGEGGSSSLIDGQ